MVDCQQQLHHSYYAYIYYLMNDYLERFIKINNIPRNQYTPIIKL